MTRVAFAVADLVEGLQPMFVVKDGAGAEKLANAAPGDKPPTPVGAESSSSASREPPTASSSKPKPLPAVPDAPTVRRHSSFTRVCACCFLF